MGTETMAGTAIRHLHELRDSLVKTGLEAKIEHPTNSAPLVKATNPDARDLSEKIDCRTNTSDGFAHWFFWSWGDPICPARQTLVATKRISRVVGNYQ